VGFTKPHRSPGALVVSYTTVSPLPGNAGRSVLCGTFPRVTPGGRYPPPCSAESGLSSAWFLRPRSPGRLIRETILPQPDCRNRHRTQEATRKVRAVSPLQDSTPVT